MPIRFTTCAFCGRLTRTRGHHVVPQSKGGRVVVPTCESCEDFIHKTWSHQELRTTFNTVQAIREDTRYQSFHQWLLKQPGDSIHRSRRRRGRPRKP